MNVTVVTDWKDLGGLRETWDAFANNQGAYEPFLSFDWHELWLRHFSHGKSLYILLVHAGDELAAIAPLMMSRVKYKGLSVNRVEMIGNVYSPIKNLLFKDDDIGHQVDCIRTVLDHFQRLESSWQILDFNSLPEEGLSLAGFRAAAEQSGFGMREYQCFDNYYVDGIDYSGDEYMKKRPGNIRQNVPYRKRKLERIGKLEFKLITVPENIDHYMDIYYELYARSWKKQEHVGPTLHRDLARMAALRGWLRLGFLFLDQTPLACQFWVNAYGQAYILKLFYDEAYQQYAPGKILSVEMFKYAIDFDRVHTIDYLQGDEPYKKDWTPQKRSRKGLVFYNRTPKGKALEIMESKVLPVINRTGGLRKIKDAVAIRLKQSG